jgi:parvulin-like peptidyl-prolyl isomerase
MLTANTRQLSSQDLIDEAKLTGKLPALFHGILRRQTISQEAARIGITSTAAELQVAADKFRTANQLETAEATWKWLQANFLTVDDFEHLVAHGLITEKLAQQLFGDRVEHFFHQNLLDYSGAAIYEVILEDRELAMEIFYSLQEGDLSFADVAYQYIQDPELKRRGGYIGIVGRKQLRPEISAAVFAAKPPQPIKPVVTAIGIHLIQVEEIVHPQLDDNIRQRILMDLFDRWLEEQIAIVAPQVELKVES